MARYNPKEIEPKWQAVWEESKLYNATEDSDKPKKYILEYFPYPSGDAMHVGHVRNYTIGDALSRYYRMNGYNVLHPMGWDAFGLPAENFAIKNKVSPRVAIDQNTARFKQQLMQMGYSYDWSREIDSTDPHYYRWTQWLFLLLFEKGLAYQKESLQWWCPHDKTVLANEQVEAGKCWRCGNQVEKKALKQWFFKITEYADRLLDDLDDLDWSEAIKTMQRNWIGKSVGAEIEFNVDGQEQNIKVFTTRPDTIFGATFLVLAPEHKILNMLSISNEAKEYIKQTGLKSEIDRMETERDKTGVFSGFYAVNPANQEKIPIWVADYVLPGYGTGAIMAVPAHDERDWQFANKFKLPIVFTYDQAGADENSPYSGEGVMKNSAGYDGLTTAEARDKIVADLSGKKLAEEKTNYKIRDWLISRQRYWGAPIPIIHCQKHGAVAVPKDQLPVKLPDIESYEPTGDGRSPLARVSEFLNTTCPKCGGPAERETDTMDGFACSSWYFLRYADPHNETAPFDRGKSDFWLPVDDYIGGAEHAVMHLLYARFWTKVMYDEGLIGFEEPFKSLRNHGMILAPDGQKMSKSKGNTVEPDGLIENGYGADTVRLMELFIGPWNQAVSWSTEGVGGCYRFLNRVWTLVDEYASDKDASTGPESQELSKTAHRTAKKVTEDMKDMAFNTAISALMEMVNELYKLKSENGYKAENWGETISVLLRLLAPMAPHLAEEAWQRTGNQQSVHLSSWPSWDEDLIKEDHVTFVMQINGKLKGQIKLPAGSDEKTVVDAALMELRKKQPDIEPKKQIFVKDRLVNFVI